MQDDDSSPLCLVVVYQYVSVLTTKRVTLHCRALTLCHAYKAFMNALSLLHITTLSKVLP